MNKISLRFLMFILIFFPLMKNNAQWVASDIPSSGMYVQRLLSFSDYLFAGTDNDTICTLFRSGDKGITWEPSNKGLPVAGVNAIIAKGNILLVGLYGKGIFTSVDSGKTWNESNAGLTNLNIRVLILNGNTLFVVSNRVFKSTDSALHWEPISDLYSGLILSSFAIIDSTYLLGTVGDGVWLSTDTCKTWGKKYIPGWSNTLVFSVDVIGKKILMGASAETQPSGPFYYGTFVSEDNGNNWKQILDKTATSFLAIGDQTFITSRSVGGGFYRLSYDFTSWSVFNEDFTTEDYLTSITFQQNYIFVGGGTFSGTRYLPKVWFRPLSEVTNVNEKEDLNVPFSFSLFQNYPNPFNPSTKISWSSPISGWQTLKVYDILGREIETLVDEFRPAGNYEINFDGSKLTSGVYFYRFKVGSFVETMKMILMK
jgi:photosystem II stability/assembly factor-like uncharacterized protein